MPQNFHFFGAENWVCLSLITRISEGCAEINLKNEVDLSKAWDNAAAELTLFSKHEVPVTYKRDEQVYKVHAWPIWDWVLDLLDDPLLAPHLVWDACCGDRWWDIQSSLPDIDGAVPFCFILYADKTKPSSHGTVKGYPVVVRCTNLPSHIQNGEGFGGGRVVGWLPIVPEDAGKEDKLGYMNLKRVVWHKLFFKLLELATQYSKTGYSHKCHNNILCMMSLIRGRGGKCPCPVCLVPLAELHDLSKTYPLRSVDEAKEALRVYGLSKAQGEELLKALGLQPVENIFWIILYSDSHDVLSLDRLHSLHTGLWKHLLGELKKILASLGREAEAAFEKLIANFPRWCNLNHFKSIINILFTDGNKYQDLSKQSLYAGLSILMPRASPEGYQLLHVISSYLQLDSWIGLDVHTESMLAAIEAELLIFDTELKGVAHNYSTRPNEKMHGPLKDTYHHRTNGKDIAMQILRVDHHQFASKLLRERVNMVNEHNWLRALGNDLPDEDVAVAFNGHVKLGSPTPHPLSILNLENRGPADRAFQAFQRKFTEFTNHSLPTYGHQLTSWLTFPADFQIHEHHYLKVNYESMVDWKQVTDHLWCNLRFHGLPWFDHALIQLTAEETIFTRLVFLFRCCISNLGSFEFVLVQLYTARINGACRMDHFFKLTRVKAVPRASSIFVPLNSFI
ncbi:hypothetical protein EDB19DRAFT_1897064 [Suillus lakei]|nr:hypothetical protein EDB19DRAFT_1897064 [Suillus lakei]